MAKQTDKPTNENKNNGNNGHKQESFAERPSTPVVIQDQGKVNALKHVTTPPDNTSRMELSDWTDAEVESLAIMKVQGEYLLDQTIDCVERHIYWKAALRRGVGSQLTEQIILLNRTMAQPPGLGGGIGGDIAATGMDF